MYLIRLYTYFLGNIEKMHKSMLISRELVLVIVKLFLTILENKLLLFIVHREK